MSADTEQMLAHPGLLEWLLGDDTGMSSHTIVRVLTGVKKGSRWGDSEPYDPGDFGRCERLLRAVPSLRPLLPQMREQSSWWGYLVDNWDQIVAVQEGEAPGAFDNPGASGSAPRAYALIKAGRELR